HPFGDVVDIVGLEQIVDHPHHMNDPARRVTHCAVAQSGRHIGSRKIRRAACRSGRRHAVAVHQRILAALSNVFQTPHASGMPTKSKNSAACQSSPPLPMPNEPCCVAASRLAVAAWSFATSSALMYHLGSTGLTR